jgi:hypothetical protein
MGLVKDHNIALQFDSMSFSGLKHKYGIVRHFQTDYHNKITKERPQQTKTVSK